MTNLASTVAIREIKRLLKCFRYNCVVSNAVWQVTGFAILLKPSRGQFSLSCNAGTKNSFKIRL